MAPKSNDGVAVPFVPETNGFLNEAWSPPAPKVKELVAGAPPLPNEVVSGWLVSTLLVFEAPPNRLDGVLLGPAPNVKPVLGAAAFAKMLGCVFGASDWGVVFPNRDEGAGV